MIISTTIWLGIAYGIYLLGRRAERDGGVRKALHGMAKSLREKWY